MVSHVFFFLYFVDDTLCLRAFQIGESCLREHILQDIRIILHDCFPYGRGRDDFIAAPVSGMESHTESPVCIIFSSN